LIIPADAYVVCRPCLARIESVLEPEGSPLTQADIDARVRRLLDDE